MVWLSSSKIGIVSSSLPPLWFHRRGLYSRKDTVVNLLQARENAAKSTVSTDTITSNDGPPEMVSFKLTISDPSARTVRAIRRAATCLPPRRPYLPPRIGAAPQPLITVIEDYFDDVGSME
jgi:hypothetical protein